MNSTSNIDNIINSLYKLMKPIDKLSISQWADEYRYLSSESSAEAGKWYSSRAPYQIDMMDVILDKEIENVVIMSSAQIGKTEIILNILGYFISYDPSPILLVQPTGVMAQSFSKDRLMPMLRDSKIFKDLFNKQRASENTILYKKFPGGNLNMSGANSPASLASRPIRIVLLDEVDRFPYSAGVEGDPVGLALKRTTTFYNKKHIMVSTPTIKDFSRIEKAFANSDQRYYHVPCPFCEFYQKLEFKQLKWQKSNDGKHLAATSEYECINCHKLISHENKNGMLIAGKWQATKELKSTAGFHINELYSPWKSWSEVVSDFLIAKGSSEQLQVWTNTSLGETFDLSYNQPVLNSLSNRLEQYTTTIPLGVCYLTAGIDVQKDRLEISIYGWGIGEECWLIDHKIIYGNPDLPEISKESVWAELTLLRSEIFKNENNISFNIRSFAIDTGGANTEAVYNYTNANKRYRIFAIKGIAGINKKIIHTVSHKKAQLYSVGVDNAKRIFYLRLTNKQKGPTYIHYPVSCSNEFLKQLLSEKLTYKIKGGNKILSWRKIRERNEALDCWVYAYAALKLANPDLRFWHSKITKLTETVK